MAEIRAVLLKHDIGGYILLHEPGFSEYLMQIAPSWSVMHIEQAGHGGFGIRFRALLAEFGGDREAHKRAVEDSVNMVVHFQDGLLRDAETMKRLEIELREHFEITETGGVPTAHRPN